jgi:hypothetical protein
MLRGNLFEEEKNAPLLDSERGFLKKDIDGALNRAAKWPELISDLAPVDREQYEKDQAELPPPDRIFIHDAERTFISTRNRQKLMRILNLLSKKFEDYHQGLSYVTSFLLLTLDEPDAVNLLQHLNDNEKYVKGYWKAQSIASATDAYVFDKLMKRYFPDVHAHLAKNAILPDTYCQKWFVGLCVHVLPFEALFNFYEHFFRHGHVFLLRFALSLIKHMSDQILKTNDTSKLYAYLRLDDKYVSTEKALEIVEGYKDFDLSDVNIAQEREEAFNKHLKARLENAAKRQQEALEDEDEITDYSDEDEDEDNSCALCKNMMPDMYCKDCRKQICEMCAQKKREDHDPGHKTIPLDEHEEEEKVTKDMEKLKI